MFKDAEDLEDECGGKMSPAQLGFEPSPLGWVSSAAADGPSPVAEVNPRLADSEVADSVRLLQEKLALAQTTIDELVQKLVHAGEVAERGEGSPDRVTVAVMEERLSNMKVPTSGVFPAIPLKPKECC
jgi:hypothetical protein